ncbi:MAG: DnaJ domain-containing protein [Sneathiella sp.]|nr:DnaJ domain-containing protein [Sneathiella sp.]
MLAYFIIGIALLAALIIGGKAIATADPKKLLRAFRISFAIILGGLAAFFAYTGRFQFAPPLALAAVFFLRSRPLFGGSRPSPGQQSDVKTDWLHATLDHDSGDMDAEILKGEFLGKNLTDLSYPELNALYSILKEDEQSAAILSTFLERNFPNDQADPENDQQKSREYRSPSEQQNGMSRTEAYEILELNPGSNAREIKEAHKKLMKKFHPDHDGSAYMAAKINQAKDILLKS